jgi:hypothetical protein
MTMGSSSSPVDQQRGFYPFFRVNRPFDPDESFGTAWWLSSKVFGGLYLLLGMYGITTVIVDIVLTGNNYLHQVPPLYPVF